MGDTSIQWTDKSWNPVTGCTKISQGCKNCYAERVFPRTNSRGRVTIQGQYSDTEPRTRTRLFTDVWTHPERLDAPLRWRKPQRVFVNSMSDLFHEDVPFHFIDSVFATMLMAKQHTFQVLTKRPQRMLDWCWSTNARHGDILGQFALGDPTNHPSNIHLGVSVEDQETANERIPLLLQTPAAVRFLSCEPLLEEVTVFSLDGPVDVIGGTKSPIHWLICGGESGPKARPFDVAWARYLSRQCEMVGCAFFMKQTGANVRVSRDDCLQFAMKGSWTADSPGSDYGTAKPFDRAGGDPMEWPPWLRIREFPSVAA